MLIVTIELTILFIYPHKKTNLHKFFSTNWFQDKTFSIQEMHSFLNEDAIF